MSLFRITGDSAAGSGDAVQPAGESLDPIVRELNGRRSQLAEIPVDALLALLGDFSRRLLRDERTQTLEGVAFLAAWLRRSNLQKLLELNLNGNPGYLDGFVPHGQGYLAAKPQGLVAAWMAGNVPTLPVFSLVAALLTKNVCLMKLALQDPQGMDRILAVLAGSQAEGLSGADLRGVDLLRAAAVVWFDYRHTRLSEQMSLAADARVVWGGEEAVRAISALPRREHCVDIVFGPKYSIGLIGRRLLETGGDRLDSAVAGLVRDVAFSDQRACSAPQTIFMERNDGCSLRQLAEAFASQLAALPAKPALDAHTTVQILNVRAEWAMDESKDVIASADANWTVCTDREVSLKEAVQSRTVFLTEIESWREVTALLTPKVQTIGIALGDRDETLALAEAATTAGVARCVRPGLMNNYESPWDGKLLLGQLVRWVTLKP